MNEEQAVLDFFAKPENLPLGLAVAVQMDEIRERMNSDFWRALQQRLNSALENSAWTVRAIEDRNAQDVLVGLQCNLREPQTTCLFPVIEQQLLGGKWRIYFGLMWQGQPTSAHLSLPALVALKQRYSDAGYKSNESFLAWQWTHFYPRRSDFLQRYSATPDQLLDEVEGIFKELLNTHRDLISSANAALKDAPRSMTISLDQLRRPPKH